MKRQIKDDVEVLQQSQRTLAMRDKTGGAVCQSVQSSALNRIRILCHRSAAKVNELTPRNMLTNLEKLLLSRVRRGIVIRKEGAHTILSPAERQ